MRSLVPLLLVLFGLSFAGSAQAQRILVMGDSFMTSGASRGAAVPQVLKNTLGAQVTSRAVTGARYVYALPITGALGLNISKQWRPGNWDFVVMNGGGNDLWLGCGCGPCTKRLNRLISPNGTQGIIVNAVRRARQTGAHVIYVGYLRSPGRGSPIEACKAGGNILERRISKMAARDRGVTFVSLANMVPNGDRSFHAADMIHPSPKGSRAAVGRIIRAMKNVR